MNTKKYNGKYKSLKYVGNKKRINRITKKKKTKKSKHSSKYISFRQKGGSGTIPKINFCYGKYVELELEIVYLYTDITNNIDFTVILKDIFGSENITVKKKIKFGDNNDYIPYFFRLPNSSENEIKFKSKDGLEDNDTNFYGTNFTGVDFNIARNYYIYKDDVYMDIYIINNLGNIDKIATRIDKNIRKNSLFKNYGVITKQIDEEKIDYKEPIIATPKKIIGILNREDKILSINKHVYHDFYNKIICEEKTTTINNDINRYVKKDLGIRNHANSCYANSFLQLIRNIIDLDTILDQYIQNDSILNQINNDIMNLKTSDPSKTLEDLIIDYNDIPNLDNSLKNKLHIYEKIMYLKEILFNRTKYINPATNTEQNYYDSSYVAKIIKSCNFNYGSQEDIIILITFLNIFGDINSISNIFGNSNFSNDKNFLFWSFEKEQGFNIFLKIENNKIYHNMQEIINNIRGEEMDEYVYIDNDQKFKSSNIFKYSYNFIKKENDYILISLKLFKYINPELTNKLYCKITNISHNICIKQLPDDIIKKIKDSSKANVKISDNLEFNDYEIINFELISITCHSGTSSGGHYINYSKQLDTNDDGSLKTNPDGTGTNQVKWLKYDDTVVTGDKVDIDINKIDQDYMTPYLFLYKRIKVI